MAPVVGTSPWRRIVAAHFTIDESTAVALAHEEPKARRLGFWVTGVGIYLGWNLTTLLGALLGDLLGDPRQYGLDAAAAAAFLALLWPRLRSRQAVAVGIAAAVVAVSDGMRRDILRSYPEVDPEKVHTVHNGIDVEQWDRDESTDVLETYGIDPSRPSVAFVGRVTRQKGVPFLLRAMKQLDPSVQLVLCAGAPDTPQIHVEVSGLVDRLRERRSGVVWIERMLPRADLRRLAGTGHPPWLWRTHGCGLRRAHPHHRLPLGGATRCGHGEGRKLEIVGGCQQRVAHLEGIDVAVARPTFGGAQDHLVDLLGHAVDDIAGGRDVVGESLVGECKWRVAVERCSAGE